jgi:recombination protein RecT
MATTALTKTQRITSLAASLEERKAAFAEMLPSHVNVKRFIKSAMLYAMRSPEILDCDPKSIITSVNNAAELGLDFTQAKGHAYLVKFGNAATFMPGYRGLIELARRSGRVKYLDAQLVYQNDVFEYELGANRALIHKPPRLGQPRGEMIGAYAVAKLDNDELQFVVMNMEELNSIRARSKAKNAGPWQTDPGEMYRKIPVRRLFKYLPCSPDLEKAIEYDNQASGIVEEERPTTGGGRTDVLADLIGAAAEAEFEEIPPEETEQAETVKKQKDFFEEPLEVGGKK